MLHRITPLALLLAPAVLAAQGVERFELRGDQVAVYNLAGAARLEPGSGSTIVVEVGRGGSDAGRLQTAQGPIDGRETLRILYPDSRIRYAPAGARGSWSTTIRVRPDGTFSDGDWTRGRRNDGDRVEIDSHRAGLDAWADLRIQIPAGARFALYLGAGETTVTNVNGELRIDGHAGGVRANGTRGTLVIDVGSGEVSVRDAEGDVDIDTGSGHVTVDGVRGTRLRVDTGSGGVDATRVAVETLDIDTGSGSVELTDASARRVRLDTGSGGITARLAGALDEVNVDTGSGGVTLYLPAAFGATVELETGSGGIDVDFPLQVRRWNRDQVSGTIGDGRGRLVVDTGSGTIRLRRS